MSGRARAGVCARSDFDRDRRRRKRTRGYNRFNGSIGPDGCRRRGKYFHVYRHERTALKDISNSYCTSLNNRNYRAYRYCYYVVLPTLLKVLWYPPDRELLLETEKNIYNMLLSYRYRAYVMNNSSPVPNREPTRLTVWLYSDIMSTTVDQQSSNEPCVLRSEC